MKLSNIISFFLIASAMLLVPQQLNGQILNDPGCPSPNGGERANFIVKFFLSASIYEDERTESGTNGIAEDQIRPVSNEAICSSLNGIIKGNYKYKEIDNNTSDEKMIYFYRTDEFYFIFWSRKPQYDNVPNTGPKTLFLVISADFQSIWEFYI